MKNFIIGLSILFVTACGFNGNQRVSQEGESYTYVVVRLDFIQEIQKICTDANPPQDFDTEIAQKKAIANCTLDHMNLLNFNIAQVTDFKKKYCSPNSDLSGMTPEQLQQIEDACKSLEALP